LLIKSTIAQVLSHEAIATSHQYRMTIGMGRTLRLSATVVTAIDVVFYDARLGANLKELSQA
jgi:hypothetical protein